jgi:ferrous iron transport protein A
MNLSQLKIGQIAEIEGFTDIEVSAPFGDPISIAVSGYELSLRKKEAATVIVI